jgi:hypothetical protein
LAGVELEQLLAPDTLAVVVFVEGFALSDLLPILKALHSQRPGLPLVFIAGYAARFALWHALGSWAQPPLVLHGSASAALVYDAVCLAYEVCVIEHLERPLESSVLLEVFKQPALELVRGMNTAGPLSDFSFDRLLPMRLRAASDRFWTPLDVVRRAALWLEELGVRSVVDIGSGVGKFCVAGALATSCSFTGIEQRSPLATVARNLARALAVDDRVSFIDGRFGEVETPMADCYYLFNPFEENLFSADEALDNQVELSAERFRTDVRHVRSLAVGLPVGAYVLTYNGMGGRLPDYLNEVRVDRELPAVLRLLQKTSRHQ